MLLCSAAMPPRASLIADIRSRDQLTAGTALRVAGSIRVASLASGAARLLAVDGGGGVESCRGGSRRLGLDHDERKLWSSASNSAIVRAVQRSRPSGCPNQTRKAHFLCSTSSCPRNQCSRAARLGSRHCRLCHTGWNLQNQISAGLGQRGWKRCSRLK